MTEWSDFPTRTIGGSEPLYRIHRKHLHPAWFNSKGDYRFDPRLADRDRFGVCYLGREPITAFVEVFGRFAAVPNTEVDSRRMSTLTVGRSIEVADLTNRAVLGDFEVTASHSTGADYAPAQELASALFHAGHAGVVFRVRHDPAMELEALALFGESGESPGHFASIKTNKISPDLVARARDEFHIKVLPAAPLF